MLTPVKPPRLRSGATIGVANVSGPVEEERLDRGLAALRSKGYRVVEAENVRSRDGFLAGSDADRAAGYRDLLRDPSVDAIFFARGGYGASRALGHLDVDEIRSNPKIHLGGSDLTALLAFTAKRADLVVFYGPMVAVQMAGDADLDWEHVLSGKRPEPARVAPGDVVAPGSGQGPLVGGCLSLLASLCGTPEAVDARGSVLFWEDVGEETYRLDRMLTQLERSGTFDGLQAMIVGSIAPGRREGAESPEEVRTWLAKRFAGAPFPIAAGFPAGHISGTRTLPLGTLVRVDLDRGAIQFLESAVA
ncbi:MAG TPA: LD-carboxypeptidase [Thermoanaerobaculia bacterium]|nr:LD-carboxypeptidase [Thermoanaerobaculia bacterium]